jgi:hypothetical protein
MKHMYNVLAHGCVATLLVLLFGIGVHLHGTLLQEAGLALAIGTATLLPGVFALIGVRMWFNLASAGRIAEIATFGLIGAAVFKGVTLALPSELSITHCAFEPGFATVLLVVPLAFLTGNLKSFSKRSWLPRRMKSDPADK